MEVPYRLIAVDIDGTLLDSHGQIPPANREALHRAHEAGVRVCFCTGRSFTETRPIVRQVGLDLDDAVCVFGAIVADARTGRTLHAASIPSPTATRLLEFYAARHRPVLLLQDAAAFGHDYFLIEGENNAEAYERWEELECIGG